MSHRVVLCGSMSAYDTIVRIQTQLTERELRCLAPVPEDERHAAMSQSAFEEFKRRASRRYLNEVRRPETYAVLVVNQAKHGVANYIGANTFAEIAMAFQARKRIFVLHDLYAPYEDELVAWRAVPLCGDLRPLVSVMQSPSPQLRLDIPAPPLPLAA